MEQDCKSRRGSSLAGGMVCKSAHAEEVVGENAEHHVPETVVLPVFDASDDGKRVLDDKASAVPDDKASLPGSDHLVERPKEGILKTVNFNLRVVTTIRGSFSSNRHSDASVDTHVSAHTLTTHTLHQRSVASKGVLLFSANEWSTSKQRTTQTRPSFATLDALVAKLFQNDEMSTETLAEVRELVTFEGKQSQLLRGIPLSAVVRQAGAILRTPAGSSSTYSQSRPVKELDNFLSHNWSTQWWKKLASLSYHFNFWPAFASTFLFGLLVGIGNMFELLPTVRDPILTLHGSAGCFARFFCAPFFIATMFSCRFLLSCFGVHGPMLFLDKVCINQVDEEEKKMGIMKLGAFLGHSKRMIVVYEDAYLTRLWTIYEVATFLALRPIESAIVVPPFQTFVFIGGILCMYFYNLILMLIRAYTDFYWTIALVSIALSIAAISTVRRWCRVRRAISERLSMFSVKDCRCSHEDDRPLVYGNIVKLMRAKGVVSRDVSDSEALNNFDDLVRQELPTAFRFAMGAFTFSYRQYLLVGFFADGVKLLDSMVIIAHGAEPFTVTASVWLHGVWMFSIWPLAIMWMEVLSTKCLDLKGWKDVAYTFFVVIAVAAPCVACSLVTTSLYGLITEGNILVFVTLVGLTMISNVVLFVVFSNPCRRYRFIADLHRTMKGTTAKSVLEPVESVDEEDCDNEEPVADLVN